MYSCWEKMEIQPVFPQINPLCRWNIQGMDPIIKDMCIERWNTNKVNRHTQNDRVIQWTLQNNQRTSQNHHVWQLGGIWRNGMLLIQRTRMIGFVKLLYLDRSRIREIIGPKWYVPGCILAFSFDAIQVFLCEACNN